MTRTTAKPPAPGSPQLLLTSLVRGAVPRKDVFAPKKFPPGKIVADLAASLALGRDCLADIAVLREQTYRSLVSRTRRRVAASPIVTPAT
jgi:hypothetical protein